MGNKLSGKRIMITGASSGIGKEIAFLCAKEGAHLILLGRNHERLVEVALKCGKDCDLLESDLLKEEDVKKIAKKIAEEKRLDVLINCAGFGRMEAFDQLSAGEMVDMFQVNVLSTIFLTQKAVEKMKKQGYGHVMTIASQAGKIPTPKSSIYSATKSALIAYHDALRLELYKTPIHITTVNPGPVDTPFFDLADKSGMYLKRIKHFVLKPDQLAQKMLKAIGSSKREINQPFLMELAGRFYRLFPKLGDFIVVHLFSFK